MNVINDPVSYVNARLYGEPVLHFPADLYIPPEALEIFLEAFEGPLDLLLYLIRKQQFNVLDIPMAALTAQYLKYVDEIRSRSLELAGEYLLMAALLIEIKARMLLPKPSKEGVKEEHDPRAELVRRLLEYEQFKEAAKTLNEIPQLNRDFFKTTVYVERAVSAMVYPDVNPQDLVDAFAHLMQRAKLNQRHTIMQEALSVREHMSSILKQLSNRAFFEFEQLFDIHQGVSVLVVHFLAILELAKESLIEITDTNINNKALFPAIYVRLRFKG